MNTPPTPSPPDLDEIHRQLQRGTGHEWVTDDNVKALIALARTRGDALTVTLLQEWRSPCAPAPDAPDASSATS